MVFKKGNIPWNTGKKLGPLSEEHKRKISVALKGRPVSDESRRKMSEAGRGKIPWNKGKKTGQVPWNKGKKTGLTWNKGRKCPEISAALKGRPSPLRGRKLSEEHKRNISKAMTGRKRKPFSDSHKRNMSEAQKGRTPWNKGKKHTEETKRKMSLAKMGEKNSMYGKPAWNRGMKRPKISESLRGKNNPNYGKRASEEKRAKLRRARLNQVLPTKNTSIEVAMQEELCRRGIMFETHAPLLNKYRVDIKIEDLIIECDGNYWHNFPNGTEKDHRRDADLKEAGYGVLRFWESEINEDISRCVDIVEMALEHYG